MIPRRLLTVRRKSGGEYVNGVWVPGTVTEFTARYSVQPTSPDDMQSLPEGRRERRAYTLFGNKPLLSVGSENPDLVSVDGEWYEVSDVQEWRNTLIPHTRAIVTRLEDQPSD